MIMISPRWNKVFRDLWLYKTRTILVVLSIAIGVFAFGTIAATRQNVLQELRQSFLAINPESATIRSEPFDEALEESIRRMEGVAEADAQRRVAARIQTGEDTWEEIDLFVIPDDGDIRINRVEQEVGAWPPPDHAVIIERSSLGKTRHQVGDQVTIELAGGDRRTMPLSGLAHDLSLPPAPIAGRAFGYITFDTLEWLGGERYYNEMQIVVANHRRDSNHIQQVAEEVADKIERSGREVETIDVPVPLQHPAEDVIPTIMLILGTQGMIALLLGGFLIINTIEAILTQQIRQIGMMKAIGARNNQIMSIYLAMVLLFGVLSLFIAVPLGSVGALQFSRFMAGQLNFDLVNFTIPWYVLVLEIAAALVMPLLAALPAVRSAVGITVRQAIDSSSIASGQGKSAIDRLLEGIRGVPRPVMLSLRNTFRRKGRLLRTLGVLALAGAIFISVLTVRRSLFNTLDESIATKRYDIEIQFSQPQRRDQVEQHALALPGVVGVESWGAATAYPVRSDGSEGESINLYAPPLPTRVFAPEIEQGCWLLPDDSYAVVVSSNYLTTKAPGTQVGDDLVLEINGEEDTWRIVGVSQEFMPPNNPAIAYINYDTFARIANRTGEVDSLRIVATEHSPAAQEALVQRLEAYSAHLNLDVRSIRSTHAERDILTERFNIMTAVLSIMATLIGTVGGLGLMGTMSINVIERTREIGIMRAIGASDGAIQQIVVGEGTLIGMLAWGFGIVMSLPISRIMSLRIGLSLFEMPLSYTFASYAVLFWLVIVLCISALASYLPARSAAQLTVRDVLSHE
jgi:putative ABC transport system permease protein